MKDLQLIFLLIFTCFISCKPSEAILVDTTNNKLELGKCYFSIIKNDISNTKKEQSFILKLVPPQYKTIEVSYSDEQLQKYSIGNDKYRFQIMKSHSQFIIRNEELSKFTTRKNAIGYMYCLSEIPTEYRVVSEEDLHRNGNKVKEKRIVSNSKILKRYVKKKPKKLDTNEYFFESASWEEVRIANALNF